MPSPTAHNLLTVMSSPHIFQGNREQMAAKVSAKAKVHLMIAKTCHRHLVLRQLLVREGSMPSFLVLHDWNF